jgi:hypothetical protein
MLASLSTSTAILWDVVTSSTGSRSSYGSVDVVSFPDGPLLQVLFLLDRNEDEVWSIKDETKQDSSFSGLHVSDLSLRRFEGSSDVWVNFHGDSSTLISLSAGSLLWKGGRGRI